MIKRQLATRATIFALSLASIPLPAYSDERQGRLHGLRHFDGQGHCGELGLDLLAQALRPSPPAHKWKIVLHSLVLANNFPAHTPPECRRNANYYVLLS